MSVNRRGILTPFEGDRVLPGRNLLDNPFAMRVVECAPGHQGHIRDNGQFVQPIAITISPSYRAIGRQLSPRRLGVKLGEKKKAPALRAEAHSIPDTGIHLKGLCGLHATLRRRHVPQAAAIDAAAISGRF